MPFHGGSRQSFLRMALTTRNGPDHNKRLFPGCDRIGERGVGRLVGEVFFAGEEAQKGAALLRVVIADGAAQHGIAGLERVQHRALRDRALDVERHLAADVRQGSEMEGEDNADHCTNPADAKATRRFSSADRTVASVGPAIHS